MTLCRELLAEMSETFIFQSLSAMGTMCRMFAVLSVDPVNASQYLSEAECSLYQQARRGNQSDGCGIGYYEDGRLNLLRSEKAIWDDDDFVRQSSRVVSDMFIAHVRKASNPKNLPREVLISEANSQPFRHDKFLFVHNGTLFIPDQVTHELGDYRSVLNGVNDSEVLFAFLLQTIEKSGSIEEGFRQLEPKLWSIHRRSGSTWTTPYRGLNIMLSDGKALYAYEKYIGDCGESICSNTPVFELQYFVTDSQIVVASERMTESTWRAMPNGALLKANVKDGRVLHEMQVLS